MVSVRNSFNPVNNHHQFRQSPDCSSRVIHSAVSPILLHHAIITVAIWPAFQPHVDLHLGHIVGFEVLARWTDPKSCNIPPSAFIPLAEETGLIGRQ